MINVREILAKKSIPFNTIESGSRIIEALKKLDMGNSICLPGLEDERHYRFMVPAKQAGVCNTKSHPTGTGTAYGSNTKPTQYCMAC